MLEASGKPDAFSLCNLFLGFSTLPTNSSEEFAGTRLSNMKQKQKLTGLGLLAVNNLRHVLPRHCLTCEYFRAAFPELWICRQDEFALLSTAALDPHFTVCDLYAPMDVAAA